MTHSLGQVSLVVILVLFAAAPPVVGQARFDDVYVLVADNPLDWLTNKSHSEQRAVFIADGVTAQLHLEVDGQRRLTVPRGAVSALHYEESAWPRRLFGRRAPYLTIHYRGEDGAAAFAILRLSPKSAPQVLEEVGRTTMRPIDRTASTAGFLGLPIHVMAKHSVFVTDRAGRRVKGLITALSPTSIELGPAGRFDAASVRHIEVTDPLLNGAVTGAALIGVPVFFALWNGSYCDDCSALPSFIAGMGIGVASGALIDRRRLRTAYHSGRGTGPRAQVRPIGDRHLRMLQVSFTF